MQHAEVTFADIDDDSPGDKRLVSASDCTQLGVPDTTIWQWASRGLVIDGERRKLQRRALDGKGKPLYFREDVITFRDSRRVALADKLSGCQSPVRAESAQNEPDHRSNVVGLSHVQGGAPVPDQAPQTVTVKVDLDTSEAERKLDAFCNRITARIGQAVAAGLTVRSITVSTENT